MFPVGKLVTARLLTVSQTDNSAKLSLKASVVLGDKQGDEEIKALKVKQTIEGTVQTVASIGVFIAIKGTSLVGLCRRSEACEDSEELNDMYQVGAFVRAKVLKVSKVSRKIALGLKPSFFVKEDKYGKDESDDESNEEEMEVDDDEEEENDDDDDDDDEEDDEDNDDEEEDDDSAIDMLDEDNDGSDDEMDAMIKAASVQPLEEEDDDEEEEERSKSKKQKKTKASKAEKKVVVAVEEDEESSDDEGPSIFATKSLKSSSSSSMQWADFKPKEVAAKAVAVEEESDDEEEVEEEKAGKGTRTRQKEALKRREEQAIRAREASLEEGTLIPERPEDFERLLLAEPSSSLLWVKYMTHYLLQADLDACRAIAERGLRAIGFQEEEEKFNVWISYINMEYKYGDMASLDAVFKRAVMESKGKR
jgi:rRNA biogenesis protein RRP5